MKFAPKRSAPKMTSIKMGKAKKGHNKTGSAKVVATKRCASVTSYPQTSLLHIICTRLHRCFTLAPLPKLVQLYIGGGGAFRRLLILTAVF